MLKNFNKPIVNKREWQTMNAAPSNALVGHCIIAAEDEYCDYALVLYSATQAYIYDYKNDAYENATNPGLAGTYGTGTAGVYTPWGTKYAATAGSANSITVASATYNITGLIVGKTLIMTSGTQEGFTTTVTGVLTDAGNGDITVYLKDALPAAIANGDTFKTMSGAYYVVNGGAKVANNFKVFDLGTRTWSVGLNNTALAGFVGEIAISEAYKQGEWMAKGDVASGTSTTMVSSRTTTRPVDETGTVLPAWTANQWVGYQVTITKGLFKQTRVITANTATSLTVASAFLFTPDNTCTYKIEGDEDSFWLIGNSAAPMYKYSINANIWNTPTPSVARAGLPAGGVTCNIPTDTGRTEWSDENNIRDGRYIYSLRGGNVANIDRYDIATNKWESVNTRSLEPFSTGLNATMVNGDLYIKVHSGYRFLKYNVVDNVMYPFSTIPFPETTVAYGNRLHAKKIKDTDIVFLYSQAGNQTAVYRTLLY